MENNDWKKEAERANRIGASMASQLQRSIERNSALVNAMKPFLDFSRATSLDSLPDDFNVTHVTTDGVRQLTAKDFTNLVNTVKIA